MIRLGINIDHVATLRNARGENHPNLYQVAKYIMKLGANSITIHLREDRRHIKDNDLKILSKDNKIPLNLEIAATKEMLKIAKKQKPSFICIVPEKRKEITTEGGLNLNYKRGFLKKLIKILKKNGSRISLFIEPNLKDIKIAKEIEADCIEIHTGKICNAINKKKSYKNELNKIKKAVSFASNLGLEIHAGHGLTFKSAKILSKIKDISEFNIGHFLVGESIFIGLKSAIKKFKKII